MIDVVTESHPDVPGMDTGVSHALARSVGAGETAETFRIHRTGRIVAFGRQDRVTPGYARAVQAARDAGFLPVERLAGGRAAVFHEDTLAFSWAIPADEPRAGITERFRTVSRLIADAFGDVGAPSTVGELTGEYCPGAYSVHLETGGKVMGVGQRLVRGAAHVGGVIVVDGGRRIADVLVPVYDALGITWDPATSGDLRDRVPDLDLDAVRDAILARLAKVDELRPAALDHAIVEAGRELADSHIAPAA